MNSMIPLLLAMLPVASAAQSQTAAASGVPDIAIPKTTAVLVIESAGVNLFSTLVRGTFNSMGLSPTEG